MDPLKRMREYLVNSGTADEAKVDAVYASAAKDVQDAIEHAKAAPEPSPDTLYNDIYSPEFIQRFGGEL
jgi:TPP-dependent pyruvate/acetoin dehydrogenase alpha subunit